MISAPFANEQYRKQQRKATEKLLSKSYHLRLDHAALIFVYGGAISALPEAFFFGYSGAIFERLKVSFH